MSTKVKWIMVFAVLIVLVGVALFAVMQADVLANVNLPDLAGGCVGSSCNSTG